MTDLFRIDLANAELASIVLARAFQGDPNFRELVEDDDLRKKFSRYLLYYAVREGVLFGEAYAVSPDFEGVAVWHGPNVKTSLLALLFRAGAARLPFEVGVSLSRRVLQWVRFLEHNRRVHAPSTHWHLQLLGVDPSHQQRGHAKTLLEPILARCDRTKVASFLDTQNPMNVGFYERMGFSVVHKDIVPSTKVETWFMMRPPSHA